MRAEARRSIEAVRVRFGDSALRVRGRVVVRGSNRAGRESLVQSQPTPKPSP